MSSTSTESSVGHTPRYPSPGWDLDADGVPIHDSAEERAADIARREQIRDAAPEMLATLREVAEYLGDPSPAPGYPSMQHAIVNALIRAVRAAIAAAEGR